MAKTYKTKKPTGLAFTRQKNVFKITWKAGDSNYDRGQQIYWSWWGGTYKYNKKKKKNEWKGSYQGKPSGYRWINVKERAHTFKYNITSYYPYQARYLTTLSVWIRGCRSKFDGYETLMSDGVNLKYDILAPSPPKVSVSADSTYDNRSTFTWKCPDSANGTRIFIDYERETMLVANCNETDGSKVKGWGKATKYPKGTTATSQVINEGEPFRGNYSWTRWMRVRCRGPRGASKWTYARRVYAMPAYAYSVSAKVDAKNAARGFYRVNVAWKADATVAHPIDSTTVEYKVVNPTSVLQDITNADGSITKHVKLTPPSMDSATSVSVTKDSGGWDGIVFTVPTESQNDNCVVVRVNTKHDKNVGTGETTYVKGSFGPLPEPTITSIGTVDPVTKRVEITAENESGVDNTHLAIFYKTSEDPGSEVCVGIIPNGQKTKTITLPDSCLTSDFSLGVQARLGDYSPTDYLLSGPTIFTLTNDIMISDKVWSEGTVPQAPRNITLTSPRTGTIRVSWEWSWKDASGAELSWADTEDAWESTDQPQTYTVDNTNASVWNISGLDVNTWYVRIRLFKTLENGTIYGAYSETRSIKLASAPAIPSLTLSDYVIPKDGAVTCYWAYTTTDGTYQNQAEICEATVNDDGSYTYGEVIARTNTNQYLTIYPEELGWDYGETHYLAVRVTSSSGETSEGWSVPISLAIADRIAIEFENTSLVDKTELIGDGADSYVLTDDVTVESGKTYYIRTGEGTEEDPYVFTPVETPESNPAEAGYYELNILSYKALTKMPLTLNVDKGEDSYVLTDDQEVDTSKTYYIRTGEGTEEDPYVYTEVTTPESNPAEAGYYEKESLEGDVTIIIERSESYLIKRPDLSEIDGFENETIAIISKSLKEPISIENDDLIGLFDDGAKYHMIASIIDSFGQTSETEPLEFRVEWDHQAVMPSAEVEVFDEDIYSTIVPLAPVGEYEASSDTEVVEGKKYYTRTGEGTEEDPYVYIEVDSPTGSPKDQGYYEAYNYANDSCDIYRLSADAPELILENAVFGTKYVDPYPTLKIFGGYRVVYKTVEGDYITPGNNLAWVDYDSEEHQVDRFLTIIDFGNDRVILPYDLDVSNTWSKDFTETKYLGGSIQGDWNPTVSRTSSVNSNTIVEEDPETIQAMRRLATYAGICRVRTPEGSNYCANVTVKENREARKVNKIAKFSIDITRVDSVDLDGVEYDSWIQNG